MTRTVVYKVQYFHPHKKEWKSIRGYEYDNQEDAEIKAKECQRGFGKTRVIKTGYISV